MRALHFIFILSALLLAGCGQKGPLYLPQQELPAAELEQQVAPMQQSEPSADTSKPDDDSGDEPNTVAE